jgi:LmbE family N-acetylglucosaminyl deacetylase
MEWNEIGSALVVVAHPDDAEFGCAGTAARLTSEGKRVDYVIVTDGSKGSSDPAMTPERLSSIRQHEQCEAARILGVSEVSFLRFPDGMIEPTLELRKAIAGCIRRFKPDVVISQNPTRELGMGVFAQHPDHLAVGESTLAAIYPTARDRLTFPELLEEGLEPHAVKEIWVSGTGAPDFTVDITSTIELKVQALKAHASQISPERAETLIPQRAKALGEPAGYAYAEVFRRLRMP